MGRHRRSAAGRAATGRASTRVTQKHGIRTDRYGPEDLYDVAGVVPPEQRATRSHRKKRAAAPVRMGLLGVCAAVAVGTLAVATGVLPGGGYFTVSGGSGSTQADGTTPSGFENPLGGTSGTAQDRGGPSTSRDFDRSAAPSTTPSASASSKASAKKPSKKPHPAATKATAAPPSHQATTAPKTGAPSVPTSAGTAAEAQVLRLVNQERAKVGCSPLSKSGALTKLAEAFSDEMAAQNFFDHTDPSGKDPWARATALGISNLGAENIARGQATAQAVMDAWMNSPGHRANILDCGFKTLGVGVHFGAGGPWWTQDFGY